MKRRRAGYTLVECLVVCVLMSMILGTSALTMHALYQAEHRLRDDLDRDRSLESFAEQLRQDAHLATSAAAGTSADDVATPDRLTLVWPGEQTVQYTCRARGIERVLQQDGAVQHRETYRLLTSTSGWRIDAQRPAPLVSLLIERQTANLSDRRAERRHRVQAAVGLVRYQLASPTTQDES